MYYGYHSTVSFWPLQPDELPTLFIEFRPTTIGDCLG